MAGIAKKIAVWFLVICLVFGFLPTGKVWAVDEGNSNSVSVGANQEVSNGSTNSQLDAQVDDESDSNNQASSPQELAGGKTNQAETEQNALDATSNKQPEKPSVNKPASETKSKNSLDALAAQNKNVLADGEYIIRMASTNTMVIDVYGASKANSANVQLWKSKMGKNQLWRVTHDTKGYVTFTNVNSGKVLDIDGGSTKPGANVSQFTNRGTLNQKWVVVSNGDGTYRIISASNQNLSLDIYGGSTAGGANVQVWTRNNKASQKFAFVKNSVPNVAPCKNLSLQGYYSITSAQNQGFALDLYASGKQDGTNIQLWNKTNGMNQLFRFNYVNGYYQIINAYSNKALNVENGCILPGANVSISTSNPNSKSQLWSITVDDSGNYKFVNAATNLSLDIAGGTPKKGANIQGYSTQNNARQSFKLTKATKFLSDGGVYLIRYAGNTNRLLDVEGVSKAERANVEIYQATSALNQRWCASLVKGTDNTYTFRSLNSGKYLSVVNNNAVQSSSNGAASQWVVEIANGNYLLRNVQSGKYLDIYQGRTTNGTNVQVWQGNGKISQQFKLEKVNIIAPGPYFISSFSNNNLSIEVYAASTANNANVQVWSKSGKDHQKWLLTVNSDGTYTIANANSGKVLDIDGASQKSGANVSQFTKRGTANQKWKIRYNDDGSFSFVSALNPALVLNISGSIKSGSNVNVTTDSGAATQKFFISRTTYNPMPADQRAMLNRASGYSSGTNYLILVDRSAHKVGVFKGSRNNWSLQYYWSCVTGAPSSPTITGTYRTTGYKKTALSTDARAIWCTQIWGGYFFHSILVSESELGKSLSHGCIRLPYTAARWMYDNIRVGTTVVIYN